METKTATGLTRAGDLGVAIRIMANRMRNTERDINHGVFLAPERFANTAAYRRLVKRQHYQDMALARLVFALTDLVPR